MKKKIKSSVKKGNRGYLKYPGADWKEIEIVDYEDLQRFIGGYFELVPLSKKLTLYCDEYGKSKKLESNMLWMDGTQIIDTLVGPLVLLGPVDRNGNNTDATEKTIELLEKYCVSV